MAAHKSSDDPRLTLVERFFSGTGTSYDFVVNAATFGIDRWWKRIIVAALLDRPRRVLDLACGTGILTFRIAKRYPDCEVIGVELRNEYLDIARAKAERKGLNNIRFVQSRAEDYASDRPFDCIVSSYLAKYADLETLTRNCKAMLEPGGILIMHDFTYPPKPYLVRIWRLHFRALQLLGTPLLPKWREIFFGLPDLIAGTRWCDDLKEALETNGFEDIHFRALTLYGSTLATARRPYERAGTA